MNQSSIDIADPTYGVPSIPNEHLEELLDQIHHAEAERAARISAMQIMQPSRFEICVILIMVVVVVLYAVAR